MNYAYVVVTPAFKFIKALKIRRYVKFNGAMTPTYKFWSRHFLVYTIFSTFPYSILFAFFPASITAMLSPQLWWNLYDSEDLTGPLETVGTWVGDLGVGDWGGDRTPADGGEDLTAEDWGGCDSFSLAACNLARKLSWQNNRNHAIVSERTARWEKGKEK